MGDWTTIACNHPDYLFGRGTPHWQRVVMPFSTIFIRNTIYLLLYTMKILLLRTSANPPTRQPNIRPQPRRPAIAVDHGAARQSFRDR